MNMNNMKMSNIQFKNFDRKKDITFDNYFIPIIYVVASILLEIATFIALDFGFLPTYFIIDLSVMFIVFTINFFLMNKIAQTILTSSMFILQAILSFINVTLFNIYGDLFSFDMMVLGGEAFKSFDPSFINYGMLSFMLILFAISLTLMILSIRKKKLNVVYKSNRFVAMLLIFCLTQCIGMMTYQTQINSFSSNQETAYDYYFNNDEHLYDSLFIKSESLKKFGTYGFYLKNLNDMAKDHDVSKENIDKAEEYLKLNYNHRQIEDAPLKGDNLIVIMCESLEWYAVDPILTPTLYKLYHEGITFNNYISKSKTNYSEMDSILGAMPSNNSFTNSFHGSSSDLLKNELPFTMPNMLKAQGYDKARFFHDNAGDFYGRSQTHPVFGFDEVITLDKMDFSTIGGIDPTALFQRDSDMFKICMDKIAPDDEKFYSFITTITTHGPYKKNHLLTEFYEQITDEVFNDYLNRMEKDEHFNRPKDQKHTTYLRNYIATCMDLNKAVELLMDHLENTVDKNGVKLIDNTTIVLYADHNAYFHDMSYVMRKGIDKGEYYKPLLYRIPAAIYSPKLTTPENKEKYKDVDEFTNPYNILPTVFDLLGISYNANFYMAPSIYNPDFNKNIFISQIGGVMTDKIYSADVNNLKIIPENRDKVSLQDEEQFRNSALNFFVKQDIINDIYNTNLFVKKPEIKSYI